MGDDGHRAADDEGAVTAVAGSEPGGAPVAAARGGKPRSIRRSERGSRRRVPGRALLAALGGFAVLLAIVIGRTCSERPQVVPLTALPSAAAVHREELASRLGAYVAIDTSTPPGIAASGPHLDWLQRTYLDPLALEHWVLDGRILLARWPAEDPEPGSLVFLSHADVVPVAADERSRWRHDPFGGEVSGGYVWGRGTLDNKASTVCLFEAIAALKRAGLGPRRDIWILVVPDEEIGGQAGAGRFVERYRDRLGAVHAVFDEGSFISEDLLPGTPLAAVAVGEKHYVTVELRVEGEAGHASMPTEGAATRVLAAALGRVASLQFAPRRLASVDELLDRVADRAPLGRRLALKNRWLLGGFIDRMLARSPAANAIIRDTIAVTMLTAGVKDNVIPATASATLNLRLLPGSPLDAVLQQLAAVIADPRVQIEVQSDWGDTPVTPYRGRSWQRLEAVMVTAVPGVVVAPMITPGTTDGRYFARQGWPVYRLVPFRLDAAERAGIHGIDERVSIDNLQLGAEVYAHLLSLY